MTNYFFLIIILLIIIQYVAERYLNWLNRLYWSDKLPVELSGIYDEEKYKKSQLYEKVNDRFELLTSSLSTFVMLMIIGWGLLGWLDTTVGSWFSGPFFRAVLFFGILGLATDLLGLPFQVYHTFYIEKKFGFNLTSVKTFVFDKVKGWLLSIIIGGGILAIILWVYGCSGQWFWLITWAVILIFSVIMNMFYSSLIVPLFNKQTPLEEGELRNKIIGYSMKVGFKLNNIYVLDGSRRSTKANAYFSGLGPRKRIILFDTLIKEHTDEEIVAVLAHEIGHYKKKHTLKSLLLSALQTGLFLFLMSLLLENQVLAGALGGLKPSFHLNLTGFGLLYTPVSFFIGILSHYFSRKYEYEADKFAAETYSPHDLAEALKKISVNHLSNLRPHPVYVFCYYSHPPLLSRLKAISLAGTKCE
ncbi:MAG: M48 family metallopeptidase [Bacteroidetes bacterium]|nr:M48 family metallopeptidase [Bacteroidota bacterium]